MNSRKLYKFIFWKLITSELINYVSGFKTSTSPRMTLKLWRGGAVFMSMDYKLLPKKLESFILCTY